VSAVFVIQSNKIYFYFKVSSIKLIKIQKQLFFLGYIYRDHLLVEEQLLKPQYQHMQSENRKTATGTAQTLSRWEYTDLHFVVVPEKDSGGADNPADQVENRMVEGITIQ
jgi:hypothetical protein